MPKRKTIASVDRQIEQTKQQLKATKARYDQLAAQLQALEKERTVIQAEVLVAAMAQSGKTLDEVLTFLRRLTKPRPT